jgi:hypothetical protein
MPLPRRPHAVVTQLLRLRRLHAVAVTSLRRPQVVAKVASKHAMKLPGGKKAFVYDN